MSVELQGEKVLLQRTRGVEMEMQRESFPLQRDAYEIAMKKAMQPQLHCLFQLLPIKHGLVTHHHGHFRFFGNCCAGFFLLLRLTQQERDEDAENADQRQDEEGVAER